ncbi:DUF4073 domain-containing protein [Lysinibacillus sp. BW-2-10]|uniref:DUF4073 domain-containing protein n=1 Tax=Lysinibacillus sp. BW-2-10 TaxID=2590030 RepID=UPI00117F1BCE|nr:DUF4073 domain-containing protein [Lysinibacillus sp. BW-2-10]TSI07366.1 DUF4073 domain-containing protein [Lysinibacillus sp. BW-2-10]
MNSKSIKIYTKKTTYILLAMLIVLCNFPAKSLAATATRVANPTDIPADASWAVLNFDDSWNHAGYKMFYSQPETNYVYMTDVTIIPDKMNWLVTASSRDFSEIYYSDGTSIHKTNIKNVPANAKWLVSYDIAFYDEDESSLVKYYYSKDGTVNVAETVLEIPVDAKWVVSNDFTSGWGWGKSYYYYGSPPPANSPEVTLGTTAEDIQNDNGLQIFSYESSVTHYKIENIKGGKLYKNDSTTVITEGSFITSAEGGAGLKFQPNSDENTPTGGTFSFDARAAHDNKGKGLSAPVTAYITVSEVNDIPSPQDDYLPAIEMNSDAITIPFSKLLDNDKSGPENESDQKLTITGVQKIDGGVVKIEGSDVIFTPDTDFHGVASFQYTMEDNGKTSGVDEYRSNQALAFITIQPRANIPTVTNAVTDEDTQTRDGLVITPTSAGGATTNYFKISGITGGELYKANGTTPIIEGSFITVSEGQAGLKFTPAKNVHGSSGFGFNVQAAPGTDGTMLSNSVPVSITVREVNDTPYANDDVIQAIEEDSDAQIIPIAELLKNDTTGAENESNQQLNFISVDEAVGGSVEIVDSNVVFTPQPNYFGNASFRYTVEDNGKTNDTPDPKSDTATVSFQIKPKVDIPSVTNTTTPEDTMSRDGLLITKNADDGSEVTHLKISEITGGTLYKNNGLTVINNGDFITISEGEVGLKFKPNSDDYGETGFSFKIQASLDMYGTNLSDGTTAIITVTEVNDAPVAIDDTLDSISFGTEKVMIPFNNLITNDLKGPVNENGQILSVTDVNAVTGGTVSIVNGQVEFITDPDFLGTVSFTYTIADNGTTDGVDDSKTATAKAEFNIHDTEAPTITLHGDNPLYLLLGEQYQEPGYAAEDEVDGDLTDAIEVSGNVDNEQMGIYKIKYNVTDSSGNAATEVARNVQVVSNKLRVLTSSFGDIDSIFDPEIINYKLNVPNSVLNLDITAAPLDPTATLTLDGQVIGDGGTQVYPLEVGENTITLVVTAQGGFTKTYTLEVTRDYGKPEQPNVMANDDLNVIVGADDTMEYSKNGVDGWIRYNSTSVPKFPGNEFIWVRVKAIEGENYASDSVKLTFTENTVVPIPNPIPNPTPNPTPTSEPTAGNGSSTEIITVDVDGENGELLNKTPIQRTTETNGSVKDFVTMPDAIAKETVLKAKESKNDTARIMIPDAKDLVSETKVEVPKSALSELKSGNLNLEIYTDNVTISIPKASLSDYTDDLYFRLVPIKKEEERQQVEERAKKEEVVKEALGDGSIEVVGRPMTIETNLTSRKVDLILPLQGVTLPEDPKEREEYLNNLGIFIEHSDGNRVLVRPVPVEYKEGVQGLKFTIEKFSTFTIVKMDNLDEYFNGLDKDGSDNNELNTHKPYIYGFEDGTFRTDAFITRSQMAAMLARNLEDIEANNLQSFKDVSQKNWAYNDILETTNARVMSGVGSEQFDPKGFVTRAQMASIAYRWIQKECAKDTNAYENCSTLNGFGPANYKDVSNNHWAKEAIDFLKMTDIMIGYNDQTFKLNQKLTRAEAVKVLNRLFKRGPLTGVKTPTFKDVSPSYWAFKEIEEAAREHTFTINQNGHEVLK